MDDKEDRWVLSDWKDTVKLCKFRNNQHIRCTLDILGESTKSEEDVKHIVKEYKTCLSEIKKENLKASLAVKLSALGANVNQDLCKANFLTILKEAQKNHVIIEIDMEGTPLVEFTLKTALDAKEKGNPIILALQAYLERTENDLKKCLEQGITVRLVKGGYKGDIADFESIQGRFRELFEIFQNRNVPFLVGTHDYELIDWMEMRADKVKLEFGFLRGLADRTKISMQKEGWLVSEYVPFGKNTKAYETRRMRYLSELKRLKRIPVP